MSLNLFTTAQNPSTIQNDTRYQGQDHSDIVFSAAKKKNSSGEKKSKKKGNLLYDLELSLQKKGQDSNLATLNQISETRLYPQKYTHN